MNRASMKMKFGKCAYCGEWSELTRDHIPPKCLFGPPRPSNLITVPSCDPCNRELSRDDEYFRLVLTLGIDSTKFPRESSESLRAIKSLGRPDSLGFARMFQRSYATNPARIAVDEKRVKVVLHRVTRGLFYHHRSERLPPTVPFDCRLIDLTGGISELGREVIAGLEGNLSTIGNGAFRYAYDLEPWREPDPFGTTWLMRFYDHRTFFCMTAST